LAPARIFFVDALAPEESKFPAENLTHFRLRSSILRLTLDNLRVLWNEEKAAALNRSSDDEGRTFDYIGANYMYVIFIT
jgi:hypothetical protein